MSAFMLTILTPERVFYNDAVQRVTVRTAEGDLGILARHEKYAAALPACPVRLVKEDGSVRLAALAGGILKISPEQTVILTDAAEWAEDIDTYRAELAQEKALHQREAGKSKAEQRRAEAKLLRARNRLKVSAMKT